MLIVQNIGDIKQEVLEDTQDVDAIQVLGSTRAKFDLSLLMLMFPEIVIFQSGSRNPNNLAFIKYLIRLITLVFGTFTCFVIFVTFLIAYILYGSPRTTF